MSISTITTSTPSTASSAPSARAESVTAGVTAALAGVAAAASDGVSATVSLSGRALHALQQAGETAVNATVAGSKTVASAATGVASEVEDLAVGAWHAGEAAVDAMVDGAHEVVSTVESVGKALGHYAEVGLSATGEALSEVASGTVMAAAAGGKAIVAML